MGFICLFIYIVFSVVSPAEAFPELAPFHIAFWAGTIGLVVSAAALVIKGAAFLRMPQFWLLLAFTIILCLSTVIADRYLASSMEVLNGFNLSLIVFGLVVWNVDSLRKLNWTAVAVVIAAVALSGQALYAIKTGWHSARLMVPFVDTGAGQVKVDDTEEYQQAREEMINSGNKESIASLYAVMKSAALAQGAIGFRVRGNGVMQDPNDLALGLVTSLPLCWLALRKGKRIRNLLLVWIPTAVMLGALYYTRSRGAVVSLIAVLAVSFWKRIGKVRTGILLGMVAVGMLALNVTGGRGMQDDSSEGRLDAWSEGYQMFMHNPVLGVGYERFTEHNEITAHNSFVLCFSESGLLGYFCWLGILIVSERQLAALAEVPGTDETSTSVRRWASALRVSLVGFVVGAFFLSRTYIYLVYMLVAMCCMLVLVARKNKLELKIPSIGGLLKRTLQWEMGSIVGIYLMTRLGK